MSPTPPRQVRRSWLVLIPFVLFVTALVGAARPESPESAVVAWVRASTWNTAHLDKTALVLDTTAADVPSLVRLLTSGDEPQRLSAARALGYGGGDAAIAALRTHRDAIQSAPFMLALALAQRGNAADRLEMMKALDPKTTRDAWLTWGTATTLGSMRATDAIPALEHAARNERPEARYAFDEALRLIREGFNTVEGLPGARDEDRILAAVLRHGVPGTISGSVFTDDDRGGAWIFEGTTWRFRAGGQADGATLRFAVVFNGARTRAIVSSSLVRGPLNGSGCEYLVTRGPDGWRVDAMHGTWVS